MPKSQIFLHINIVFLLLVAFFSFYPLKNKFLDYAFQKPKEIQVFSKIQGGLTKIRNRFETSLNKTLPEPQASFMAGLTVGTKRNIPKNLNEDFIKTGTIHIIALSGYNITIIGKFIEGIFGIVLPAFLSFWITIIFIILFTIMTGASASIVRAAIMGILVLVARRENRIYSQRNALIFAASIMVFQNPTILIGDRGFQLSFLATIGLLYFSPFFEKKLKKITNFFNIRETLIATLSAQIAVFPLIFFYFGRISIISPIANILILPVIPLSMLFGFLIGAADLIFSPLAHVFAIPAWILLTYKIKIIEILANMSWSSISF